MAANFSKQGSRGAEGNVGSQGIQGAPVSVKITITFFVGLS